MATLECPYCGSQYGARRRPVAGHLWSCKSAECTRARKAEYQHKWELAYKAEHGSWSTRRFAEDAEKKAARSRRRNAEMPVRQRYPAQFAAKDARRRMRVAEATVEEFDPREVFERDGWICGVCGDLVDPSLKYPDPRSKSLDHVVPIARGGTHSSENAQLAHLRCNILKSDREVMPDGYSWSRSEADREPEWASV